MSTPTLPSAGEHDATNLPEPTVTGTGWDAVVELPAGAAGSTPLGDGLDAGSARLLDQLTTPVDGGRALQTSLLSVLLLDDGRILAGAVPIESLEAAAQ